jgi:hypothetical protein
MRPSGKVFCILAPFLIWPIPAWTGDVGASQSGADERVMPGSNVILSKIVHHVPPFRRMSNSEFPKSSC